MNGSNFVISRSIQVDLSLRFKIYPETIRAELYDGSAKRDKPMRLRGNADTFLGVERRGPESPRYLPMAVA